MNTLASTLSAQQQTAQAVVHLGGRQVEIDLSKAAQSALSQRSTPLWVEMELYFSCLIRKQVRFRDSAPVADTSAAAHAPSYVTVNDQLHVCFRPVMTRACGKDYEGDEPPLTDFPITKPQAYVPHWLHIDYRNGQWHGEFGYRSDR
jgi:hypothetical protein